MLIKLLRKTLVCMPDSWAFRIARALASLPSRPPLREADRRILDQAQRFEFQACGTRVAWSLGEGPIVVLVHGWGGRAGQLAGLAQRIASRGFTAILFDSAAHGESSGKRIEFGNFAADTAALVHHLKRPVHACVGHSAGGLGMMAARTLHGLHAERYICICAPRAPYVPVDEIRKQLNPGDAVLERCRAYYAQSFGQSWEVLDRAWAYSPRSDERLMLIYDRNDGRVEPGDGHRILQAWPQAELVQTEGLGHQKVLWDSQVADRVCGFLGKQ